MRKTIMKLISDVEDAFPEVYGPGTTDKVDAEEISDLSLGSPA